MRTYHDDSWEWGHHDDGIYDWDIDDLPQEYQASAKKDSSTKPKNSSEFSQDSDEEDDDLRRAILLSKTDADEEDALIQRAILLSQNDKPQDQADKPQDEAPSRTLNNKASDSGWKWNDASLKIRKLRDNITESKPSDFNRREESSLRRRNINKSKRNLEYDYQVPKPSKPSYFSNFFQSNNDDEDKDLQMAILLSKTSQTDAAADEEDALQQALLLSMESLSITNNSNNEYRTCSFEEPRSDWADLISPESGDLKLKGVCFPLEMKPLVKLSNVLMQLGEPSTSVCAVCKDELPTGKMVRLSKKCGHVCCHGCRSEYLGRAIKENIQEPRCPEVKCKEMLPWLKCCAFIPSEVVQRRFRALEEAKELKNLADKKDAIFKRVPLGGSKSNNDGDGWKSKVDGWEDAWLEFDIDGCKNGWE